MKMNLLKKLALIMTLILVFTSFAGCSGAGTPDAETGNQDTVIEDYNDDNNEQSDSTVNVTNSETTVSFNPADSTSDFSVFEGALFIGDSRTEGLQLYAGIKNADFFCAKGLAMHEIMSGETVNIPGGETVSIQEMLDNKAYKRVYIGLGMNDLGMKYIEEFIEQYKELIALVKEEQPDATIYVQALIPVTQEKSDNHEYVNNGQIFWYNTHIYDMTTELGVTYINPDKNLVGDDGALIPGGTTDGVHFSRDYCKIWAENLAELTK